MEFKDRLKLLRKEKKLTQESLGRAIHISRSAIAKWEAGLGLPSEDSVIALCKFFHVERKELFPNLRVEELLVEKNVKISRHKRSIAILVAILFTLIALVSAWQVFSLLGYVKREREYEFLRGYVPTVTNIRLNPHTHPLVEDLKKEDDTYILPKGEFVEICFYVKLDKLFDGNWLEFKPKFENFSVFTTEELIRRSGNDDSTRIIELVSYIKTDDENVTELKLSKLVFAHYVDGVRYEKECVVETRTLSVAVRDKS